MLYLIQVVFPAPLCRLDLILNLLTHLRDVQLRPLGSLVERFARLKGPSQDCRNFLRRPRSMLKATFGVRGGRLLGGVLQNLLAGGADAVLVFEGGRGHPAGSRRDLVDGSGFRVGRLEAVLEILKLLIENAVVLELQSC